MKLNATIAGAAGSALLGLSWTLPAAAKIVCNNGFQNVAGQWLSTPYCQDAYVATVARQFGVKASAESIRNNPNYKREVCRLVGQDIRIKDSCDDVNHEGRGRF